MFCRHFLFISASQLFSISPFTQKVMFHIVIGFASHRKDSASQSLYTGHDPAEVEKAVTENLPLYGVIRVYKNPGFAKRYINGEAPVEKPITHVEALKAKAAAAAAAAAAEAAEAQAAAEKAATEAAEAAAAQAEAEAAQAAAQAAEKAESEAPPAEESKPTGRRK
jgi:hypothetical protein